MIWHKNTRALWSATLSDGAFPTFQGRSNGISSAKYAPAENDTSRGLLLSRQLRTIGISTRELWHVSFSSKRGPVCSKRGYYDLHSAPDNNATR